MTDSYLRDQFHWAGILSFVTGLVNQELLLPGRARTSPEVETVQMAHENRGWG
jgi:hypothetical protein